MTVKELKAILSTIEDENLNVYTNGYYTQEINGYFYGKEDNKPVLFLTPNNVQPRIIPEK
jgi:hypothetical protein